MENGELEFVRSILNSPFSILNLCNTFAYKFATMLIEINRIEGDFGFEAKDVNGHTLHIDTSIETGGTNFGVRPMQSLLMGLGGCSGIDIISILKKQRFTVEGFSIKIDGEREKGKEPSLWESVHMVFKITGNIDQDKAERACALSINKYCSVAETLRRSGTKITWQVIAKPGSQSAIQNPQSEIENRKSEI